MCVYKCASSSANDEFCKKLCESLSISQVKHYMWYVANSPSLAAGVDGSGATSGRESPFLTLQHLLAMLMMKLTEYVIVHNRKHYAWMCVFDMRARYMHSKLFFQC